MHICFRKFQIYFVSISLIFLAKTTWSQCNSIGAVNSLSATVGACQSATSTASVSGGFDFATLGASPGTMSLVLNMPSTGLTLIQTFNPPFIIGGSYPFTFTGIPANGSSFTITASFLQPGPCGYSVTLTAPLPCLCAPYAGTFNQNLIGSSNSATPNQYHLCFGDILQINSNGDNISPQDNTAAFPGGPTYSPGLGLLTFSCPPSISAPMDITTDPCFIGVTSYANGNWNIPNSTGNQSTLYFVPTTVYSLTDSVVANLTNNGYCYDLATMYEVTFLSEIVETVVQNCSSGTISVTLSGGMPAFDGSNFNVVPGSLTPATATLSGTTVGNNGVLEITGLVNGASFSFDVVDSKNCPKTISGIFAGPAISVFTYSQVNYCANVSDPVPTLNPVSTPGGVFTSLPAGLSINSTTGQIDLSASILGTYQVTYTTSNSTCPTSSNVTVAVNVVPTLTLGNEVTCAGTNATFTPVATPVSSYNFLWTVPVGLANPGNVSSLATNTPGSYSVAITDQTTGCSNVTNATLTTNPLPTIQTWNEMFCPGTSATVTSLSPQTGTLVYNWTVPAGFPNPGNTPSFTTNVVGNYIVQITDLNGCSSLPATSVVSASLTYPSVSYNQPSFCTGDSALITAIASPAGTFTYTWNVPPGATNPGNNSAFYATVGGVYTIQVLDLSTGCSSNVEDGYLSVLPLPTVSVDSPDICAGGSATITATPGVTGTYTYSWIDPLGVPIVGNVSSITATLAGVYSVQITDVVTGCVSTISTGTLAINPLPVVTVNDEVICQGIAAQISATPAPNGVYSYAWTVPTGATNPGDVASFSTSIVGAYSVQITDANGCTSLASTGNVTQAVGPTVVLNDSTFCAGGDALLTATPGAAGTYTYTWTVPAGAIDPGNVNSMTTTIPGSYGVQISDATSGCSSSIATGVVAVSPIPTVTVNSPTICSGSSATITATSGVVGIYYYSWTVPAGAVTPGNVSNFTTSTPGTYDVQITNTATGCVSAIASSTVTENPLPVVTVNDEITCQGVTAQLTATPALAGTYTYVWSFPAGATDPGDVASFSTSIVGAYSVQITDANGCTSLASTGNVTQAVGPTVVLNDSTFCAGGDALLTATPGAAGTYTYTWTVPAGAIDPGNVNTMTTNVAGSYDVQITDILSGCISSIAAGVVAISPTPIVTVNSPSFCAGSSATITATSGVVGIYDYSWTVPAGAVTPGNVSNFTTSTPGTYDVQITNTATGCVSAIASSTVTINPLPVVTVNDEVICQGIAAQISATPAPNGLYSYAWTVPTGATNPGDVASFSTSIVGAYSVQITDANGCTSLASTGNVTQAVGPTVVLNDSTFCAGGDALLTATPGAAGTYTYTWTVPAGAIDPGNVNSMTTTIPGSYGVQISDATSGCSSSIATGVVAVSPIPTVTVNSPTICSGSSATITATSGVVGIYDYSWTVPAGAVTPGNVSNFTTSTPGTYDVQITNTATGCVSAIASSTVTENPLPVVTVNDEITCQGVTAQLTATPALAGTYTYVWSFPAGATDPGDVASFSTSIVGAYSVQITDANGCTSLASTGNVTQAVGPTVVLNDSTFCAGGDALLTATPGAAGTYTYTWTVPAGAVDPGNVNTMTTNVAGSYDVQITDILSGCISSIAAGVVAISPTPIVTVNSPSFCAGSSATITSTPGAAGTYSYTWTVPAGATAPGNVSTFTTTTPGTYDVQITNAATGCVSAITSSIVTENLLPVVSVNDEITCQGTTAQLIATPNIPGTYSYAWTVPTGAADPGNVASFSGNMAGSYSVLITDVLTGCISLPANGSITILPNPIIDAGLDQIGCDTDNFTLNANGAGAGGSYVWNNGVIDGIPFSPAVGVQTYTVTGTTIDGCLGTDDVDILVDQTPVVSFNFVQNGSCAPVEVTFTNTSVPAGTNCVWIFDNGDVVNGCGPITHLFNTAGFFGVDLQVESVLAGCVSNAYQASIINVEEHPIAGFTFSPNELTTINSEVVFSNTSIGATNYSWSFGDNSGVSNASNPIYNYPNDVSLSYTITLIATTPAGCADTATAVIQVAEELLIYVPNAFTPDDNEFNRYFQPVFTSGFVPEQFNLLIFDRWGEVMFESADADFGWDGTYGSSGKICQDGTYIWKISYKTADTNEGNILTGHVTLIR